MMTDIVQIGFSVRTGDIEKGYKRLDKMGDSAEKAETKIGKMAKGAKAAGAAVAGMATAGTAAAAAIVALMNHLANVERELQASARMAGMTANQFEAMSFAYRQFGLTVEQVNDIYKDSRERVGEWLSSQSGALQDFGDVMGMSKDEITAFAKEVDGLTGQQLLQRMVDDMQAAGVSANQMSFALESMASEATRMIPALENNGKAVNNLKDEYNQFNSAFSLDESEVQNYADLAKNFDLFLDTAQNGITKVLAPLAGNMAALANATTHFLSSLKQGSESALSDRLVVINEEIDNLNEAIEDNQSIGGRLKNSLFGFVDGTSTDSDFLSKKVKQLKDERKKIQEKLAEIRFGTKGLIDTSKPLEIVIKANVEPKKPKKKNEKTKTFAEMYGGTDTVDLFALNQAKEYDKWIESISTTSTKIADLRAEIEKTQKAVAKGDITSSVGADYIKDLEEQIKALKELPKELPKDTFLGDAFGGINEGILAFREFGEAGTKEYERLTRAAQAFAAAQAIATGNIFGAIGIAGSVVSSLKNRGLEDDSAANQQKQFLDAFGNKQDSIATATEMTASASDKLVGINTKMLDALTNLRSSILSAAGIVSQETRANPIATPKFVTGNIFEDVFGGGLIGGLLGGWADKLTGGIIGGLLGGKQKVTDEGIKIIGGAFTDLIEDVTVGAFQTVKYKKWALGSTKTKELFSDLGDDVSSQFSLVFADILSGVVAGAETLGLSQAEIDKAVEAFSIATQKISLKGLSAEQQQNEINAYFSGVLNDLTGVVVPFIDDFQKAGEELGETLARLATEVNIFELVGGQLGVIIGDKLADPQAFAEAANNLSELAGGVESFAEKTSQFIDSFAPENVKLDIYADSLTDALGEVGLTLPSTAEGFWQLMQGLDATTEAGQEQIATLLNVAGQADAYYSILERITDKYRDAASAMYDMDEAARRISIDSALAAARMGDFSLADSLNLSGIAPQQSDFSSAFEYNLARSETAAKLNELADLQSGQVTVQDKQLNVLEQIRDNIAGSDNGVESEIKSLKDQMYKLQTTTNDLLERMTYQLA